MQGEDFSQTLRDLCGTIYPPASQGVSLSVYIVPWYSLINVNRVNVSRYAHYISEHLSEEDLDILMRDETERRKTFVSNWPHQNNLSGIKMAESGFFYLGEDDRVKCVFCKGILFNWHESNDPMAEHRKAFSFCEFVKGLFCGNIKYQANMLSKEDIRSVSRVQTLSNRDEQIENVEGVQDRIMLGIQVNHLQILYQHLSDRFQSFHSWSPMATPGYLMSAAGFYSLGRHGAVVCFCCRGGFKNWTESHDPWQQHAMYYPTCHYLLEKKGQNYVNEIQRRFPVMISRTVSKCEELIAGYKINCKKCGLAKFSSVWYVGLPCGHFLYCEECNFIEVSNPRLKCPSCQLQLKATFKIFLC